MLFEQIQQLYQNAEQALKNKQTPDGEILTTKAWLNHQLSLDEAQKSLLILKNILEKLQQNNQQGLLSALIGFLKNRDLDVTRKNIGYTSMPQSTMNLLCKDITEIICQELVKPENKTLADKLSVEFKDNKITNKARYKILMPSLKIIGVHRVYNFSEDDDLPAYGGFLLSDKLLFTGTGCVINYQETVTLCRDLFTFVCLFYSPLETNKLNIAENLVQKKTKLLIPDSSFTAGEVARLREFTPQGKYFFQSRDAAKESLEKGETTRIKLNLLIKALRQGSVTQNTKFDQEFGESAAIGLAEFYQYWHKLPPDIKARLSACGTPTAEGRNAGGTTLAFELNLLERWLSKDTQNMTPEQKKSAWLAIDAEDSRPCINTIQVNLSKILNFNKENNNNLSVLDEVPMSEARRHKIDAVEPPLDIQYGKDGLLPEYPLDKIFTDICMQVTDLRQCTEIMEVLGVASKYKAQQQQLHMRFITLMNALPNTEDKGVVLFNRLYELNNGGEQYELCAQLLEAIGYRQLNQWDLNEQCIRKILTSIYLKKDILRGYKTFKQIVNFNDFLGALAYANTFNQEPENKMQIIKRFFAEYKHEIIKYDLKPQDLLPLYSIAKEKRVMILKCLIDYGILQLIKNLEVLLFLELPNKMTPISAMIQEKNFELLKFFEPNILKLKTIGCSDGLTSRIIYNATLVRDDNDYEVISNIILHIIRISENVEHLNMAYEQSHSRMIRGIVQIWQEKIENSQDVRLVKNIITIIMKNKDVDHYNEFRNNCKDNQEALPDDFIMLHLNNVSSFDELDRNLFLTMLNKDPSKDCCFALLKEAINNNKQAQALFILKHFLESYEDGGMADGDEILEAIMYLVMKCGQYDLFKALRPIIEKNYHLLQIKCNKQLLGSFIIFLNKCVSDDSKLNEFTPLIDEIIVDNDLIFEAEYEENHSAPILSMPLMSCFQNERTGAYILDKCFDKFQSWNKSEKDFFIEKIISVVSEGEIILPDRIYKSIEQFLSRIITVENIPQDFLIKVLVNPMSKNKNWFNSRESIVTRIITLDPKKLIDHLSYTSKTFSCKNKSYLSIAIEQSNSILVPYLCRIFYQLYPQIPGNKFQAFFSIDSYFLQSSLYYNGAVVGIVNSYRINVSSVDEPMPECSENIARQYWLDYLAELYYSSTCSLKREQYLNAYNRLCIADDNKAIKEKQKEIVSKLLEWITSVKDFIQPIEDASRSQDPGRYALKYIRSIQENYGLRHWLPKLLTLPFAVMDLIPRWQQKNEYESELNQLYSFLSSIYNDCMSNSNDCKEPPQDLNAYQSCTSMLSNQEHMKIYSDCHDHADFLTRSRGFLSLIMIPCILLVLVKSAEIKLLKQPFRFLEVCLFGRYQSTKDVKHINLLAQLLGKLFEELFIVTQSDRIKPFQDQLKRTDEITADNILDMLTVLESLLKQYQEIIDTLPAYEVIGEHDLPQFSIEDVLQNIEEGSINSTSNTTMPLLSVAKRHYGTVPSSPSSPSSSSSSSVPLPKAAHK